MKQRVLILMAATAVWALAQGPGPGRMRGPMGGPGGPDGRGGMMGLARVGGKTVTGAPFAATTVMESVQVLSDGNRVTTKNSGKVYRDSEGRTRTESSVGAFGPFRAESSGKVTMVSIDDPVAQQHIMLDSSQKTASRMSMPKRPSGESKSGASTSGATAPARAGRGPMAASGTRPERKTESLGTQVMEGVSVTGTRETMTIAAGTIGNDRAIDIVTETWYSNDLQTVVYRKHSDPRNGETIFRLTEIQRAEPDKTLFAVPADYTTKTARQPGGPRADQ